MRRAALAVALLMLLLPSAVAASTTPILAGPSAPDERGYGHVEPSTIFNGGDPTGLVDDIEWLSWGGARAIGVGRSTYVGPNEITAAGTVQAAVVVLFHLGSCHGRRGYDAVEWYFPEHGQHFSAGRYRDACTGSYHE